MSRCRFNELFHSTAPGRYVILFRPWHLARWTEVLTGSDEGTLVEEMTRRRMARDDEAE